MTTFWLSFSLGIVLMSSASVIAAANTWDYGAEFDSRAYPLSAIFSGNVGATYFLWGEHNHNREDEWRYGYVRPNVTLASIGVTNVASGALDVFPVSFFGVSAGWMNSARYGKSSGFDCNSVKCDGLLKYNWIQPKFIFGGGPFFGVASLKMSQVSSSDSEAPFVEDASSLVGGKGKDVLTSWQVTVGAKVARGYAVAGIYSHEVFRSSENGNRSIFAVVSRDWGPWSWGVGPGVFSSSHVNTGVSGLAFLQWTGLPGPGLEDKR